MTPHLPSFIDMPIAAPGQNHNTAGGKHRPSPCVPEKWVGWVLRLGSKWVPLHPAPADGADLTVPLSSV